MLVKCLLCPPSLVSRSFKETKIKTSSNAKQMFEALLTARQRTCAKEFLELLNWLNVHGSLYLIFLNFTTVSVLTNLMKFTALLTLMM